MAKFEVDNYYEMIALYRALMAAKFMRDQIVPELPGSPFIADMFIRLADALNKPEKERGKPERANWRIEIDPDGEIWSIAVRDTSHVDRKFWDQCSGEEKREIAKRFIAPFLASDEIIQRFVAQVNERVNARKMD